MRLRIDPPLLLWIGGDTALRDLREQHTHNGALAAVGADAERIAKLEAVVAEHRASAFDREHSHELRRRLRWRFTRSDVPRPVLQFSTFGGLREWILVDKVLHRPRYFGPGESFAIPLHEMLPETPVLMPAECTHGIPGLCQSCGRFACLSCHVRLREYKEATTDFVWCIECTAAEMDFGGGGLAFRRVLGFQRWWNAAAGDTLVEDGILGPATRSRMRIAYDAVLQEIATRGPFWTVWTEWTEADRRRALEGARASRAVGVQPDVFMIDDPTAKMAAEHELEPRGKRRGRDGKTDQERGRAHLEKLQGKRGRRR